MHQLIIPFVTVYVVSLTTLCALSRLRRIMAADAPPDAPETSPDIANLRRLHEKIIGLEDDLDEARWAMEIAIDGVLKVDGDGAIDYANAACYELMNAEALEGVAWIETIHPDDRDIAAAALRQMVETGKGEAEVRAVRRDGPGKPGVDGRTSFWSHVTVVDARSGYYAFMTDITARKLAEGAQAQTQEQFNLFMKHVPAVCWAKDVEGRYIFINHCYETTFSVTNDAFSGRTDADVWPADLAWQYRESDQRVIAGEAVIEVQETVKGGDRPWLIRKFAIPADRPTLIGGVAIETSMPSAQAAQTQAPDAPAEEDPEGSPDWKSSMDFLRTSAPGLPSALDRKES